MALFLISAAQATEAGLAEPHKNAKAQYDKFIKEVQGSETAKKLIADLTRAGKKIGVLVVDNESGFDSMYIPPHVLANASNADDFNGGVAVFNFDSQMKIKGTKIPLGVSLMHELGHAKQSLDNEKKFAKYFKLATNAPDKKDSKKIIKLADELKKSVDKAAQLAIENENIKLHEAVICTELKLPARDKYD